jgi:hypothetical protein
MHEMTPLDNQQKFATETSYPQDVDSFLLVAPISCGSNVPDANLPSGRRVALSDPKTKAS